MSERSRPDLVRVLVVEDNHDDSDLLVRQLLKNNFDGGIKVIRDGGEAWNFLTADGARQSLIALFLDVQLPSINGMSLLHMIKAHAELQTIPVFIMTSTMNPEIKEKCASLGVDAMEKPVHFSAFAKVIANFFHLPPSLQCARTD